MTKNREDKEKIIGKELANRRIVDFSDIGLDTQQHASVYSKTNIIEPS